MPEVIGPLRRVLELTGSALSGPHGLATANARLLLHRCLIQGEGDTDLPIRAWAVRTGLGQQAAAAELLARVAQRREAALQSLEASGLRVRRVRLSTDGPVLTGAGEAGVRNVGIALHGTYGWPVLPGSTLKGTAHAHARDEERLPARDLARLFGAPRPGQRAGRAGSSRPGALTAWEGAVAFLDALPEPGGVAVTEHVMTPHATAYYTGPTRPGGGRPPPAEYYNPVPVPFLAVDGGSFLAALIAEPAESVEPIDDPPDADGSSVAGDPLDEAEHQLTRAVAQIGLGAKTAAGFGYFVPPEDGQR